MKKQLLSPTLLGALLFAGCAARADNVTVEAETNPTAGDIKILDDPTASGGKAVSIPRDYQPLLKAAVPAGEKFTIWVRHKGGSILVKHSAGGKQGDLKRVSGKAAEFTWNKIGTYTRAELGETLRV
ncbi:MAG: hypothetical protein KY445_09275, partial [Armatimonadetes bacterium]|nr:hypothetical protein [Armatimonadota bacterium]